MCDFHTILTEPNLAKMRPEAGRPATAPELTEWTEKIARQGQFPPMLLVLGVLRLANHFEAAQVFVRTHDAAGAAGMAPPGTTRKPPSPGIADAAMKPAKSGTPSNRPRWSCSIAAWQRCSPATRPPPSSISPPPSPSCPKTAPGITWAVFISRWLRLSGQLDGNLVPRIDAGRRDLRAIVAGGGEQGLPNAGVVPRLIVKNMRPLLLQEARRHDRQSAIRVLMHLQAVGEALRSRCVKQILQAHVRMLQIRDQLGEWTLAMASQMVLPARRRPLRKRETTTLETDATHAA